MTLALLAGTVLLAVELVGPGRVAPVRDSAGKPVAGSVAELVKVHLGGVDQWVSVRATMSPIRCFCTCPVVPAPPTSGGQRTFNAALEEHFTLVVWEQRGLGKSYPALDPVSTFTLDRLVTDGWI